MFTETLGDPFGSLEKLRANVAVVGRERQGGGFLEPHEHGRCHARLAVNLRKKCVAEDQIVEVAALAEELDLVGGEKGARVAARSGGRSGGAQSDGWGSCSVFV